MLWQSEGGVFWEEKELGNGRLLLEKDRESIPTQSRKMHCPKAKNQTANIVETEVGWEWQIRRLYTFIDR